jgi:UDP-2,3-diacylglucosamine hydrolase
MPMTKHNQLHISKDKKIFFVSDQHFGLEEPKPSLWREKLFVKWLDEVKSQAEAIFILGDMFDYWYEYKRAVPKGFVRVLGKLAELTDAGIPIYFFVGNHDMWMIDYLEKEIGIQVYYQPEKFTINGQSFLIGHGDGLGPGDKNFKRLKKLFTNKLAQWSFRWLHPDIGLKLVKYLSQKNKLISGNYKDVFYEENESLFMYAKDYLKKEQINYFVFGHRHLALKMPINEQSVYYNTGDWLRHYTYLEFDGDKMLEQNYKDK